MSLFAPCSETKIPLIDSDETKVMKQESGREEGGPLTGSFTKALNV